jgi:hypothetical protein
MTTAVLTSTATWAVWLQDSGSVNMDSTQDAQQPNIIYNNNDASLYIIWTEKNAGYYKTYVKKYNGSTWTSCGNSLNVVGTHNCSVPLLGRTATGTIFASWKENGNIYEKHWSGTSWIQDGDSLGSPSDFSVSATTIQYVAFPVNIGGYNHIYTLKWSGAAWVQESTYLLINSGLSALNPSLDCSSGTPYVAWVESPSHWQGILYVAYSNGSGWTQIGGDLTSGFYSAINPSLAMYAGLPNVAWTDGIPGQIFMSRNNGGPWARLGGSLNVNPAQDADYASMDFWNGTPFVSWQESNGTNNLIYVKHWNGASWVSDGSYLNTDPTHDAQKPCLLVVGGLVYVAFTEFNGSVGQICLKHWYLDGISNVDLNYGLSGHTATTTITGAVFNGPAVATLKHPGNPDIVSTGSTQKSSNVYTFTFNLSGAVPGEYDVQVTGASLYKSTLKQAFDVLAPIGAFTWNVNDIGAAGSLTATGYACGLDIGDGDQDNTKELYIANQDASLYQMKKYNYGWSPAGALATVSGANLNQVMLTDGDADQSREVFGLAQNTNLYQFKGATLVKSSVGTGPTGATKALALAKADVLHTGVVQLYVAGDTGTVCQFTNTGTGWSAGVNIPGCPAFQPLALTSGDGNNDNEIELYSSNVDQKVYQYRYNGSSWAVTTVFSATSIVNQLAVGDGDHDGVREVYSACQDGKVYQSRWGGSSWTTLAIGLPASGAMQAIAVSDADSDGQNEVYAASADGHVYMFKKGTSNWVTQDLGNAGQPLFAMVIGDADNDHHFEIYTLGKNNHVFEFKALEVPTPTSTATPIYTETPTPGVSGTATPFSTDRFLRVLRSQINPNKNEVALIRWAQPEGTPVTITIYNLVGDKIITLVDHQTYPSGQFNEVTWKGLNSAGDVVGSGIYVIHLKTVGYETYTKCAVVK